MLRQAINNGYEGGFRAGQADRQDGWGLSAGPRSTFGTCHYLGDSLGILGLGPFLTCVLGPTCTIVTPRKSYWLVLRAHAPRPAPAEETLEPETHLSCF